MAPDQPSLRQHFLFLGVGLVVFLTAFQDVLIHRKGTLVRGFDASVQTFPWMAHLARQWQNLSPPLWDFTSFSGTSFAGELQTGVFYPPNILLGILFGDSLSPHTLDWYIFFHYVLAFYFMTLLLGSNGFGRLAALFGGFAFAAYLDWAQPNRLVGIIYLPLILYSYQKSLKTRCRTRVLYTLLAAASLSLTLLGGHTQPFLHSSMALALLALCYAFTATGWWRAFGQFFTIVSATVLITAPQWLLTLEYVSRSYRWAPERTVGLSSVPYEVYGFVSTLDPQLLSYLLWSWIPLVVLGGVAVLFFLPPENSARRLLLLYSLILGAFAFLASLGDAGVIAKVTWYLPILNTVRQAERYVFLILFSSAVILAVDVSVLSDRLSTALRRLDRPTSRRMVLLFAVAILSLLGIWMGLHASTFLRIQPNNDPLTPASRYREESVIRFLKRELSQHPVHRVLNFRQVLPPNLGNAYGLMTVRGHRGTIHAPYYDYFVRALDDPQSSIWDTLGVRYVISDVPLKGLKLRFREGNIRVFERDNTAGVLALQATNGERQPIRLRRLDFGTNQVEIELERPVSGRLIFAQPFYPGWEARVENRTLPLEREGLFMSIYLSGTERSVVFVYDPPLFKVGLLLALLPWLAGIVLFKKSKLRVV